MRRPSEALAVMENGGRAGNVLMRTYELLDYMRFIELPGSQLLESPDVVFLVTEGVLHLSART